uniref:I-set domain-containing protein n=1 Tax=Rhodnius prolixus TaxID=13249 RepID=T1IF61_RHOPR
MENSVKLIILTILFTTCVQVSWLRRLGDSLTLLTVGTEVYSGDQRYTATFTSPRNWNLVLEAVNQTDEGYYECQVTSHPPIVRSIYLHVVGCGSLAV